MHWYAAQVEQLLIDSPAALLQYVHELAYDVVSQHRGSDVTGDTVVATVEVDEGAAVDGVVGLDGFAVGSPDGAVGLVVGDQEGYEDEDGLEVDAGSALNPVGLTHSPEDCEGCKHWLLLHTDPGSQHTSVDEQ